MYRACALECPYYQVFGAFEQAEKLKPYVL